ncbi:heme o synthase [Salsipaludibacter albus]|uniref:heme o synthase n=1 Tax=Salsipaludibacter albus TaxID=2849650 RepID=UPI001EE40DF6|nr:heme o synthase [Salsipaludibacter albus]MBY5161799.1 heme o synthase [Salsipaludibacter albus]
MSASPAESSAAEHRRATPAGDGGARTSAGSAGLAEDPLAPGVGPLHTVDRRSTVLAYVAVTKPRIIELLLVTTVPTMFVAAEGWPGLGLLVATVLGGTLSAGGANAINNYYDRDIDRAMARTAQRPTANDTIPPRNALWLGIGLGVAGFVLLATTVNLLAAGLATFGLLFYVFVYTMLLKRRTPQAVVIGGIAGCMPVLTGWAAVGAPFSDPRPWLLFGILFWWQPPHFWALAMKYRDDYARAGLPMMPVSWGNDETTRQILLNSWLLAALVLAYVAGAPAGWWFAVPALVLTAGWLVTAHRLRSRRTVEAAMRLFHYSTVYLALVFVFAAVDAVI